MFTCYTVSMPDLESDVRVIAVKIEYILASIDEMKKEDLPYIREEIRRAIQDEVVPFALRVNQLESEVRSLDKRVWVMFGGFTIAIPIVATIIATIAVSYFLSGA